MDKGNKQTVKQSVELTGAHNFVHPTVKQEKNVNVFVQPLFNFANKAVSAWKITSFGVATVLSVYCAGYAHGHAVGSENQKIEGNANTGGGEVAQRFAGGNGGEGASGEGDDGEMAGDGGTGGTGEGDNGEMAGAVDLPFTNPFH